MEERWKPIITWKNGVKYNFTGLYEVSNLGNVRSLNYNHTGKPKIINKNSSKYSQVSLSYHLKITYWSIHRLVYESFYGRIPFWLQVNHINEDKMDNRLCNLNIITCKENNNWGTRNERTSKALSIPVFQYDKDGNFIKEWSSFAEIYRCLGYRQGNIWSCCKGKRPTAYGFRWEYKEKVA